MTDTLDITLPMLEAAMFDGDNPFYLAPPGNTPEDRERYFIPEGAPMIVAPDTQIELIRQASEAYGKLYPHRMINFMELFTGVYGPKPEPHKATLWKLEKINRAMQGSGRRHVADDVVVVNSTFPAPPPPHPDGLTVDALDYSALASDPYKMFEAIERSARRADRLTGEDFAAVINHRLN